MPVDLEIVSPEKLLLSRPVDMVVIPAAEGEMGVLPQHAPMIVLLQEGVIRLYEGNRVTESLKVSGGFAEVTPTRVTVLADTAIRGHDLDEAKALDARKRAEEAMKNAKNDIDFAKAQGEFATMAAQIAAISKLRKK